MARPCKSVITQTRHSTKAEINNRKEIEDTLKGDSSKLIPPNYLSKSQKKIFNNIVAELEASGILSNLDIYILSQCAIAIDRLASIESAINKNTELLSDSAFMNSKKKYTDELFRCCNELSLSPQARSKIGSLNLNMKKEQADPVLKLLGGANGS